MPAVERPPKTQAQIWGETAVAFIAAAAGTGVFGLLSYVLWPVTTWLAEACLAIAAIFFVVLAAKSVAIMRWWLVLAKRTQA